MKWVFLPCPGTSWERQGSRALPRSAQQGFTLVEMMVALLIFGMLAAACVGVLTFAVRAQAVAGARLDDIGSVERMTAALSADLAQATTRPTRNAAGDRLAAFEGARDSGTLVLLRLVRGGWDNLDGARRPTEQKVEYHFSGDRIERVAFAQLDGAPEMAPAVMLAHIRSVQLRYRLAGAWSDRWGADQPAALPDLIELTVTRQDGIVFRELFLVGSGYGSTPQVSAGGNDAG